MGQTLKVALAQLDLIVGDVSGNTQRILEYAARARDELAAELVVFPELSICGYPPEDLLLHAGLRKDVEAAVEEIRQAASGIALLVGFPEWDNGHLYNSAAVFSDGEQLCCYRKRCLPNYAVFDEQRYFAEGSDPVVFDMGGPFPEWAVASP